MARQVRLTEGMIESLGEKRRKDCFRRSLMRKQKGFSLIELLIVVAIILIIAAIAIPNLMRSRIAANDSAAAATIRTINTGEATYNSTWGGSGFATLAVLGPGAASCPAAGATAAASCIVDGILGCTGGTSGAFCQKDNFFYTVTINSSGADYVAFAKPVSGVQGDKDYCSAPDMVVRWVTDPTAAGATTGTDAACVAYTPL